jgi:predicted flavoprotein YhiN
MQITNWTVKAVRGERKRYEYPRYFFANKSQDIVRIYVEALERVGVEWKATHRRTGVCNVSVARRASVALMDAHIGPKY